jgi:hypothetical protein
MPEIVAIVEDQPSVVEVPEDLGTVTIVERIVEVIEVPGGLVLVDSTSTEIVELQPDIVVVEREPQVEVVEVGIAGPQGPPGPPGAAGSALQAWVHDQSTPSATWTVDHPLDFYPSVSVVDTLGRTCYGEVSYPSATQVVVTFSAMFSGKAYLS